jgi:Kef-type K+ transport system membrane component KefB
MIIGAFAAGLILHPTPQREEIEKSMTALGYFFVPIFFASIGASVELAALATPVALSGGAALIVVGVIGKLIAGFAPWWFDGNKLLIGTAMVPRGEVGLIFAKMGLASGALLPDAFGSLMLMVVVTTFLTPLALKLIVGDTMRFTGDHGDGGIDDLVAGESNRQPRQTKIGRKNRSV